MKIIDIDQSDLLGNLPDGECFQDAAGVCYIAATNDMDISSLPGRLCVALISGHACFFSRLEKVKHLPDASFRTQ